MYDLYEIVIEEAQSTRTLSKFISLQVRFKFPKPKLAKPTATGEEAAPEQQNSWRRGAKVYYTLDGSMPFPGRLSTFTYEYEDEVQLPIGRVFVVRARAVAPGVAFSQVVTSRCACVCVARSFCANVCTKYMCVLVRRYWVKLREEELLKAQEVGVVPTRPLDGVLAVTPFRSLKMTAKLAALTGCLELPITQPFARAQRLLGNKLGVSFVSALSLIFFSSFKI